MPISEVFNVDCIAYMQTLPDKFFDLAIVDPPYGLGEKLTQGGTWSVKWQKKGSQWDKVPKKEYFDQLFRVSSEWIIWGGNYFIEHLPNCRNFTAWHKPYMDGMHSMSNVELALSSFDMNSKFISINKDNSERIHVTQKPIALYKWLIEKYAKAGNKIFDSHMGSQSSRIAAYQMGFDYWGCELDEEYFNEGNKRFIRETMQQSLFTPTTPKAEIKQTTIF